MVPEDLVDDGAVTVAAQELVVTVAGGKVLLDRVSFAMPEKCLVGVIGPSGAGKSTLLGAMTGMRPFDLHPDRDWAGEFAASLVHARYAAEQRRPNAALSDEGQLALGAPTQRRRGLRQYATLTRRYARVIAADRGYAAAPAPMPTCWRCSSTSAQEPACTRRASSTAGSRRGLRPAKEDPGPPHPRPVVAGRDQVRVGAYGLTGQAWTGVLVCMCSM
jgi:hypothetical protein